MAGAGRGVEQLGGPHPPRPAVQRPAATRGRGSGARLERVRSMAGVGPRTRGKEDAWQYVQVVGSIGNGVVGVYPAGSPKS